MAFYSASVLVSCVLCAPGAYTWMRVTYLCASWIPKQLLSAVCLAGSGSQVVCYRILTKCGCRATWGNICCVWRTMLWSINIFAYAQVLLHAKEVLRYKQVDKKKSLLVNKTNDGESFSVDWCALLILPKTRIFLWM